MFQSKPFKKFYLSKYFNESIENKLQTNFWVNIIHIHVTAHTIFLSRLRNRDDPPLVPMLNLTTSIQADPTSARYFYIAEILLSTWAGGSHPSKLPPSTTCARGGPISGTPRFISHVLQSGYQCTKLSM